VGGLGSATPASIDASQEGRRELLMTQDGFVNDFKRNFLTGLAALFPILITFFLLSWFYGQIDQSIGTRVNRICRRLIVSSAGLFEKVFPGASQDIVQDRERRAEYVRQHFPRSLGVAIGILGVVVIVYLIGKSIRGYVGGRIIRAVDRFFERFPVIKAIYPHARHVADLLFGQSRGRQFRHVVAVQYPRRGLYTVGFLTGDGLLDIEQAAGRSLVTVFVPTSPTPLTGFVIVVPRDEVLEMNMSVDEAFRYCITAGMLASDSQRPGLSGGEASDGQR